MRNPWHCRQRGHSHAALDVKVRLRVGGLPTPELLTFSLMISSCFLTHWRWNGYSQSGNTVRVRISQKPQRIFIQREGAGGHLTWSSHRSSNGKPLCDQRKQIFNVWMGRGNTTQTSQSLYPLNLCGIILNVVIFVQSKLYQGENKPKSHWTGLNQCENEPKLLNLYMFSALCVF